MQHFLLSPILSGARQSFLKQLKSIAGIKHIQDSLPRMALSYQNRNGGYLAERDRPDYDWSFHGITWRQEKYLPSKILYRLKISYLPIPGNTAQLKNKWQNKCLFCYQGKRDDGDERLCGYEQRARNFLRFRHLETGLRIRKKTVIIDIAHIRKLELLRKWWGILK